MVDVRRSSRSQWVLYPFCMTGICDTHYRWSNCSGRRSVWTSTYISKSLMPTAAWTRPDVFGYAGCQSSSFWYPYNATDDPQFDFENIHIHQHRENRPPQVYIWFTITCDIFSVLKKTKKQNKKKNTHQATKTNIFRLEYNSSAKEITIHFAQKIFMDVSEFDPEFKVRMHSAAETLSERMAGNLKFSARHFRQLRSVLFSTMTMPI